MAGNPGKFNRRQRLFFNMIVGILSGLAVAVLNRMGTKVDDAILSTGVIACIGVFAGCG